MPNLWTKTTQRLSEIFNGPRSKDTDFELKIQEYKHFYQGLLSLKSLLMSSYSYFVNIKTFANDYNSVLNFLYTNTSPLHEEVNTIVSSHNEFLEHIENFRNNVEKLIPKVNEMIKGEEIINIKLKNREEKRSVYDHYEEKLEQMYLKQKSAKISKKDEKEFENKLRRNENKYKEATEKYLETNKNTYQTVQTYLQTRQNELNPLICNFLYEEKLLFCKIFKSISKFDSFDDKVYGILNNKKEPLKEYIPEKFIRNGFLLKEETSIQSKTRTTSYNKNDAQIQANRNVKNISESTYSFQNNNSNKNIDLKQSNTDFFDFTNEFSNTNKTDLFQDENNKNKFSDNINIPIYTEYTINNDEINNFPSESMIFEHNKNIDLKSNYNHNSNENKNLSNSFKSYNKINDLLSNSIQSSSVDKNKVSKNNIK